MPESVIDKYMKLSLRAIELTRSGDLEPAMEIFKNLKIIEAKAIADAVSSCRLDLAAAILNFKILRVEETTDGEDH